MQFLNNSLNLAGSTGSIVGGWCDTIWNSLFARCHTICCDVRSNGAGSHLHDTGVRNYMQWRYFRCHCTDIVARHVRYVLWICNICHLWTGTKCHTTCPRLILSNTASIWCYLAHWRNAIYSEVSWLIDYKSPKLTNVPQLITNFSDSSLTFFRYISYCLPLTQATTALRCMLTRGWGIMEQEVYLGFISTLTWIVIFLAVTMIVLRLKRGWTSIL